MKKVRQQRGFTLIEIMIAVAIVGVLAAIAIPSYQESVKKTRRTDAQASLMSFAAALERQYTSKSNYLGLDNGSDANGSIPAAAVFASESPLEGGGEKYYDLRFVFTTLTYSVMAIPKNAQAGDGKIGLRSTGERGWDKNNDDTYSAPW